MSYLWVTEDSASLMTPCARFLLAYGEGPQEGKKEASGGVWVPDEARPAPHHSPSPLAFGGKKHRDRALRIIHGSNQGGGQNDTPMATDALRGGGVLRVH